MLRFESSRNYKVKLNYANICIICLWNWVIVCWTKLRFFLKSSRCSSLAILCVEIILRDEKSSFSHFHLELMAPFLLIWHLSDLFIDSHSLEEVNGAWHLLVGKSIFHFQSQSFHSSSSPTYSIRTLASDLMRMCDHFLDTRKYVRSTLPHLQHHFHPIFQAQTRLWYYHSELWAKLEIPHLDASTISLISC